MKSNRTHRGVLVAFLVFAYGTECISLPDDQRRAAAAEPADAPDFAKRVHVKVDGKLLQLNEVLRRASADRRLAAYRQLRTEHGGTAAGQIELARWCRKQGLAEEERLHWQIVLMVQPDQPDAIKGLRLRKYKGKLLTKEEIEHVKKEDKLTRDAERKWGAKLKQVKLAIEQGDAKERAAALDELAAIRDPQAMALVETMFSDGGTVALLVVEMYAREATEASTDALVRLAVHAQDAAVREKAASELRYRPMESYMPSLVGALAAPIELSVSADMQPGGPTYEWRDGWAYTGRLVVGMYRVIHLCGKYTNKDVAFWVPETVPFSGWLYTGDRPDQHQYEFVLSRDSPDPDAPYEFRGSIAAVEGRGTNGGGRASLNRSMAALEEKVREVNAAAAEMNLRIDSAIREATKANASGQPPAVANAADIRPSLWWDWWQKQLNLNNYLAGGTEVWTQLGILPIEQVLVGDRVLTKNLDTGELSFNLLIGIDMQRQRAVTTIEVGARTIVATSDLPFYATDEGWRKAEKLKPGMELDSLAGPQRIEGVRSGMADAIYSLLIADSPNFFVDRQGIQVHDATQK